jgi:Flp pilus assembly CpaE family ATPase
MVTVCWSPKGGSGTTVVATSLALVLAREHGSALLVDLDGDVPAALGLAEPAGPGVLDWLGTVDADGEALDRLAVDAHDHLSLVARGEAVEATWPVGRMEALAHVLATRPHPVVVDAGRWRTAVHPLVASATSSLMVLRPCYLGLRRAISVPVRPSGVVLVNEPGRALGRRDIEEVLGVQVVATVELDPQVARAVDAGLLSSRLPRGLVRGLRAAA